ncbi:MULTISPECIES: molybdate ABC transporter permease subunit [unclassified Colwellia]|jgi:molybdate transport system permease protein|uniref:molybdate ABC transporter permease subunit n=2 Tax=unclassified Colwellia TaxID=196834 RepID=UPI0015F3DA02|nr:MULTISPECIES: molybdate ABC transporter permease subunit [unclassified Colwellia]MBA6236278.1 molybdate ABC transporter permease subunit [Colwellia sp. MB02u-11]MBA6233188.1 molybdate ABC transporter permease subunit [Colwellia sp. MB02u-7]MBA6256817.1 molybdate ABC transporter permease subunit [Colwellia sp. MB3u-28]MBA6261177.1 molybdate ABC transporter permease subunit [Colwellia sp. MB3u-41]MBA6264099.1 molybdate ABC transporter permease subunit [Colwellia sp. Bg11-12]
MKVTPVNNTHPDILALITTLKMAGITTIILMLIGTPLAWFLAKMQSRAKVFIEALVALPLVLPPTVLGFYLLLLFSPQYLPGQIWQQATGQQLAFSFSAIVIGSVLYSLPFVVQPLQKAFEQLGDDLLEAAAMLGASAFDRFFTIVLPITKASFITAASLGFAHTVGEFGVVLMIGGNIPGETRVLSIALFDHVEAFDYAQAHIISISLVISSLVLLSLIYLLNRPTKNKRINQRGLIDG